MGQVVVFVNGTNFRPKIKYFPHPYLNYISCCNWEHNCMQQLKERFLKYLLGALS